ncbi:hypothetical protein [Nocardia jiangsuensis]|uniref:Pyridoxamine 5'-phosphate oxidase n=1 Tax=Nocardia jiangsuensis TaxID=1691563 RepID=A0ABV8E3K2_9NOCA
MTATPQGRQSAEARRERRLLVRAGSGITWLGVRAVDHVHPRPVFAAWTGSVFVFASNAGAATTAHLDADGSASLGIDLSTLRLVVEGHAARIVTATGLADASTVFREVYDWPTTVAGAPLRRPALPRLRPHPGPRLRLPHRGPGAPRPLPLVIMRRRRSCRR